MSATFIPTLDISDGRAILVKHGKKYKDNGDPLEKAKFISIHKHFQIVDIDGAVTNNVKNNRELIKHIVKKYPCYVGGGIRTLEIASEYLNSSARRVVISSNPDLLLKLPKDRVILAVDLDKDNSILINGRTKKSDMTLVQFLDTYAKYTDILSVTFHDNEGTMEGVPEAQIHELKKITDTYSLKLICAGGISSIKDITFLTNNSIIPQFGSGFWQGHFTLGDVYSLLPNIKKKVLLNDKSERMFPCIVQSNTGLVLGLTYMTSNALKLSVDTRVATFYSREHENIWIKGATSGNYHTVEKVHFCCDNSAIRIVVDSTTDFCHMGTKSCFGHTDPSRGNLNNINSHITKAVTSHDSGYTSEIIKDGYKLKTKLIEEIGELIYADTEQEKIAESADVFYFLLLYLQNQGLDIKDIEAELIKRQYKILKEPVIAKKNDKFKIGIVLSNTNSVSQICILKYLSDIFNVDIKAPENSRSYTYITDSDKIQVIPVKPKDISMLINCEYIDAVVSYEDIIQNYYVNVEKAQLKKTSNKNVSVVITCKNSVVMDELYEINESRKLVICAEYTRFVGKWLAHNKLTAKIERVHGSAESYLVNDLCDLAVVIVDSGETLKQNNLKVLDTLLTTSMYLFVTPSKKDKLMTLI